jgi:hypothetical protein
VNQVHQSENLRYRVYSCQEVIHDLSRHLVDAEIHPKIVEQLQHLDELLELIDPKAVSEEDISRIELSTNQLLGELSELFSHRGLNQLYPRIVN